jgi:hypothetical protein
MEVAGHPNIFSFNFLVFFLKKINVFFFLIPRGIETICIITVLRNVMWMAVSKMNRGLPKVSIGFFSLTTGITCDIF